MGLGPEFMGNVLGRGEDGTCLYELGVVGIFEREKPVEKTGDRIAKRMGRFVYKF